MILYHENYFFIVGSRQFAVKLGCFISRLAKSGYICTTYAANINSYDFSNHSSVIPALEIHVSKCSHKYMNIRANSCSSWQKIPF
jgi:hypothetical protein